MANDEPTPEQAKAAVEYEIRKAKVVAQGIAERIEFMSTTLLERAATDPFGVLEWLGDWTSDLMEDRGGVICDMLGYFDEPTTAEQVWQDLLMRGRDDDLEMVKGALEELAAADEPWIDRLPDGTYRCRSQWLFKLTGDGWIERELLPRDEFALDAKRFPLSESGAEWAYGSDDPPEMTHRYVDGERAAIIEDDWAPAEEMPFEGQPPVVAVGDVVLCRTALGEWIHLRAVSEPRYDHANALDGKCWLSVRVGPLFGQWVPFNWPAEDVRAIPLAIEAAPVIPVRSLVECPFGSTKVAVRELRPDVMDRIVIDVCECGHPPGDHPLGYSYGKVRAMTCGVCGNCVYYRQAEKVRT